MIAVTSEKPVTDTGTANDAPGHSVTDPAVVTGASLATSTIVATNRNEVIRNPLNHEGNRDIEENAEEFISSSVIGYSLADLLIETEISVTLPEIPSPCPSLLVGRGFGVGTQRMSKNTKFFILLIFLWSLLPETSFSQVNPNTVLDTVETVEGAVVLYKNFSWEFLGDEPVMVNVDLDSTGLFSAGWVNDQIRGFDQMKPDSIRDTVLVLTSESMPFTMPIKGFMLRGFMYTHKGLDIRANMGDTIRAAFDGVVRYARYNRGGFGNLVIVRHYNGLETYYAHMSKIKVEVNQLVKSGDLVGLVGSTGRSRGPHLHFEVRYLDVPLDPLRLISCESSCLIFNNLPIRKEVFYPNDWDAKAVYHKIKNGDTLGHLSSKYHTSVKEICAMNKIKPTTTLRIGKVLRVK